MRLRLWIHAARGAGVAAVLAGAVLLASAAPAAAAATAAPGAKPADEDPVDRDPGDADAGDTDPEDTDPEDADAEGEEGAGDEDAGDEDSEEELPEPPSEEELAALAEQIDGLREDASLASRLHETLRREEAAHRAELVVLGDRLQRERHRLRTLRTMIGRQASSQYRAGGGAELARLVLSETPEDFLNGASLVGRGELTARQLMERSQQSEEDLRRDELRTAELRTGTATLARRQKELRAKIEARLEIAEERLTELEEAKAAAEAAAAAAEEAAAEEEAAREAAEQAAEEAAEHSDHSDHSEHADYSEDGECAVSVRDSKKLAKPAVEEEWTAPLTDYRLTAGYGSSGERWSHRHTGQDFAVASGSPVLAIGSGTVVSAGCDGPYGHQVLIEHDNGYFSQYAHLSVIEVKPGQKVGAGRRIGLSGDTGNSTGPHLHLEIRLTPYVGSAVDPMPWLNDHGVQL
jgi:murein DD-endopeptidase MepM/ murein hydrolase activator NlpD